jgi:hypothetical protein
MEMCANAWKCAQTHGNGAVQARGDAITSHDDDQWVGLEWDSIRTLLAVNVIRMHFHADVSIDELLRITADGRYSAASF